MPRSLPKLREANARMAKEPCSIPGCPSNRLGIARYCRRHAARAYAYGHPLGVPIPQETYQQELKEVRDLFNSHPDHPGLVSVLGFIEDWIEEASKGEAVTGNYILGRIHVKRVHGREGLNPLDLLVEIAAVWVFSQRYPQRLPDDERLTFALSRNLCRLATFQRQRYGNHTSPKRPPVIELRGVGERIRQVLGLFLINVVEALKRRCEQAQSFRDSLSIPFE